MLWMKKVWRSLGGGVLAFHPRAFSMPKTGRRFRDLPWSETGPGPLSGFGWGVFEKPCLIAEGDSTSLPNDLTKQCIIKRFSS